MVLDHLCCELKECSSTLLFDRGTSSSEVMKGALNVWCSMCQLRVTAEEVVSFLLLYMRTSEI